MKEMRIMLGFNISFLICLMIAFGIPFYQQWDSLGIMWDSWQQSDVVARLLGAFGAAVMATGFATAMMELDI